MTLLWVGGHHQGRAAFRGLLASQGKAMRIEASENALSEGLSSWMGTLIGYVQSARPDLTNRQMALLLVVYLTDGPHTVRGLAARLKVSKPVVTRALNTLGALGYLRRQKDESDLRNIFVERTTQGTAFLDEFERLIARTEGRARQ